MELFSSPEFFSPSILFRDNFIDKTYVDDIYSVHVLNDVNVFSNIIKQIPIYHSAMFPAKKMGWLCQIYLETIPRRVVSVLVVIATNSIQLEVLSMTQEKGNIFYAVYTILHSLGTRPLISLLSTTSLFNFTDLPDIQS